MRALSMNHLALIAAVITGGCRHRGSAGSDVREAPDVQGQPEKLGISAPYRWNDVKDATSFSIKTPWSDTYWPLADRGLAARWAAEGQDGNIVKDPISLSDVVFSLREAARSNDPLSTVYLSPAEKYDLIAGRLNEIDPQVWAQVSKLKQRVDATLSGTLADMSAADKKDREDYTRFQETIEQLVRSLNEVITAINTAATPEEAKKYGSERDALVEEINKNGIAIKDLRVQSMERTKSFRNLRRPVTLEESELANAVTQYLPMTGRSWESWDSFELSSIEDYGWMGHCHGWAPAALVEAAPKHAVMVRQGQRKVLFTEGDLRGLVTKLWADQAPPSKFAARRCNSDKVDSKDLRISDGKICLGAGCDTDAGNVIYIKNNRSEVGFIEYRDSPIAGKSKFARFTSNFDNDQVSVAIFENATNLAKYMRDPSSAPAPKSGQLHLTIGCRDVNPMTLHLALTKLLREQKQGFVFDKDRYSQVWNQPVFGYDLEYLPIKTKTGMSEPGVPVSIDDVDDPLKDFRAARTAYLVSISAQIHYGVEYGPLLRYDAKGADEMTRTLQTVYTLELDDSRNIIGGEWGRVASSGDTSFEAASEQPDFLWYSEPKASLRPSPFDVPLLRKLQACSQAEATGKITLRTLGATGTLKPVEISYSDCMI